MKLSVQLLLYLLFFCLVFLIISYCFLFVIFVIVFFSSYFCYIVDNFRPSHVMKGRLILLFIVLDDIHL